MSDPDSEEQAALESTRPPAVQSAQHDEPQGLDWKGLWGGVKRLIGGSKQIGEAFDETQTPPDDVLLGKIGMITATVATGKAGEIRLPVRGGTQDYIACAPAGFVETLEVNATAEVVGFMPPNTVYVKPAPIVTSSERSI
jgi:hypothetical protein